MTRANGSIMIAIIILHFILVSCSLEKDSGCESFAISNGVLLQDGDSVMSFSDFREFEPFVFHDTLSELFLYDGFRYVFKYNCDTRSTIDTFVINHRIFQQPMLDTLGSDFLTLSIGFEKYVIKKNDLSRYGQYTDSILRVFENEHYDTYGNFNYLDVKLSDTSLTFYLQGDVKYDSIDFNLSPLK